MKLDTIVKGGTVVTPGGSFVGDVGIAGETIAVLGCRIGVAQGESGDEAAVLLRRASEALADARDSDSATVRVAEPDDGEAPIESLAVALAASAVRRSATRGAALRGCTAPWRAMSPTGGSACPGSSTVTYVGNVCIQPIRSAPESPPSSRML